MPCFGLGSSNWFLAQRNNVFFITSIVINRFIFFSMCNNTSRWSICIMLSVQAVIQMLSFFKKKHFIVSCYSLLWVFVSLYKETITTAVEKYSWGCDEKRFCQENIFMIFFSLKTNSRKKRLWLGWEWGWREGKSKYINRAYHFSIWWCLKVTFLPRIVCTTKESFPLVNCGSVVQFKLLPPGPVYRGLSSPTTDKL